MRSTGLTHLREVVGTPKLHDRSNSSSFNVDVTGSYRFSAVRARSPRHRMR
jgi:hypothetical protein